MGRHNTSSKSGAGVYEATFVQRALLWTERWVLRKYAFGTWGAYKPSYV